jgi:hypothetical protein
MRSLFSLAAVMALLSGGGTMPFHRSAVDRLQIGPRYRVKGPHVFAKGGYVLNPDGKSKGRKGAKARVAAKTARRR